MAYQVINQQGNAKKKERLQKELQIHKNELNKVAMRSHRLLQTLRDMLDKQHLDKVNAALDNN